MPDPLRRFPALLLLALTVLVGGSASAQDAAEAAAKKNVDAALAAWAKVKDAPEPERVRALRRLGAIDDARVTEVLLDELERTAPQPFSMFVLEAIGKHARGNIVPKLRAVLAHNDANDAVRRAAAVAIGKQGNRGIDLLLDCARGDADVSNAVRDVALDGLAAADDERAWRGLAPMALKGGAARQLHVLRLLEPVADIASVTQVRVRLLQDTDPELAATAWRQLARHGYADARDAFDALLDRIGRTPPAAARAELVTGLAPIVVADQFAAFLELAAGDNAIVQTALLRVAPVLGKNDEFVRWLAAEGLRAPPVQRAAALIVLRAAPLATVQPLLQKARAELAPPSREAAELASGLQDLLRKDPTWASDVLALLRADDAAVRTTALALLLDLGCGDAVTQAQQALGDKDWSLRAAAIRYLTRFRALTAIPLLIARADKETGRLADELNDALFVHTGVRLLKKHEWEAWWQKHKDGHQLPPEQAVRNAGKADTGPTVAYFGLPLVSHHASFLIDISGSMNAKIGTGADKEKQRSRLDEAKRQLHNAVEKLAEDREFNIVPYESAVHPLWPEVRKAKPKQKQEALTAVDQLRISGGTNICDALELAFQDRAVDTIYLLTDGQPSAGRITDVNELADQVRRWNYQRQVVIHCIAIGEDSPLLKRLSKESGGSYVFVR